MRLFGVFVIVFCIWASISIVEAAEPKSESKVHKYELGFSMGRIESVGDTHELYKSGEWIEAMFGWRLDFLKSLSLQLRIGGAPLDTITNDIVYYADSSSAILAEKISTYIAVLSLGIDYPVALFKKPRTSLHLGFGVTRTYLKYSSIIKSSTQDTLITGFFDRKSDDLGRSFTVPYLRGGLDFSLGSRVGAIAELTYLRIPKAYQTGGFALGQFGPERSLRYLVISVNWVYRI